MRVKFEGTRQTHTYLNSKTHDYHSLLIIIACESKTILNRANSNLIVLKKLKYFSRKSNQRGKVNNSKDSEN